MIVLTVCSNSRQVSNWFAESTNQGSRMRPSRESIEVLAIRAGRCQEWAFVSAHVISLLRCRLREFEVIFSFWNLTKTPSSRLSLFQSFTFVVLFLICYFSPFACSLVLSLLLFLNMIMSRNGRKRITWKERWIPGALTRYVLFPVCFLA